MLIFSLWDVALFSDLFEYSESRYCVYRHRHSQAVVQSECVHVCKFEYVIVVCAADCSCCGNLLGLTVPGKSRGGRSVSTQEV